MLKAKRVIMEDATKIEFKGTTLDIYTKTMPNGRFVLQIFKGASKKAICYRSYRTFEALENDLKIYVDNNLANIQYKEAMKAAKKVRIDKLKANLKNGITVRTSFSYNMTFNKFYRVISNKGNTFTFEILETEWVDGDIGWTGNVKAGHPSGKTIIGKITASGLKIDNLMGNIIDPLSTFYENHCD